ncbi:cytochrome c biogenesis protein ResB [Desulfosarcina widdelii]|uniref:Cytochrome c biogenesis protein ResB n=1 Tax=Desulfosarcina widdelii TaxID=947919 RepID=A0A5K7ZC73_9BACT|nr:cytochrome c biogenesis protein ResB [Desulfosarcina widdelii]BBO77343.1 cytochrome c biogenesis protein ResB [Desulfosarcina widdelii]
MKNANPLWKFFCSVKLTVVLLLSLAFTSVIGTVIPQNESPDVYLQAYGAFRYQLLSALGIFDMYHSWWFQGLLLLLTVNIVVCSIDRLQGSWKVIFNRNPRVNPQRFSKRSDARSFTDKRDVDELVKAYEPVIARRFGYCRVTRADGGAAIYGEKGRLSRLGVYIVHLSVIFLLVGGLVGSFFGFEGFVNIPEGEATDTIRLRNTGAIHRLDFQIRCDDFNLELYENGAPKEYRSSLSIVEGGRAVKQKDIVVNDPIRYRGINIFQSSYGKLPPEHMAREKTSPSGPEETYTLSFTSRSSGMQYTQKAKVGEPVEIPEGLGRFVIMAYESTASFRGMDVGEALKGILTPPEGEPVEVLLPLKFGNFDKMRGGEIIIAVENQDREKFTPQSSETRYYTGLQVTRDPGVWLVYSGFILMIAGCFVTFYLSHQQVCLVIEPLRQSSRVILAGIANRNKLAMKNSIEKMFADMTERQ